MSKIKQFFSENIFYLLSHKCRHLPSSSILALVRSSLDTAQLQQSYGLSTLGHNLGRWDLGVQAQKPGLALPVLEQGSWGRGKGSISIPCVSCLLREGFSVDGSTLCIAPRQNRAPAQHRLALGSFPRSSQEQSVALQRCSLLLRIGPPRALEAELSAQTPKGLSLPWLGALNDLAATSSYFQALRQWNEAPTLGALTMQIVQKNYSWQAELCLT